MTISLTKLQRPIEPFECQCTLCTILIGGQTTTFREMTKRVETRPRKEQMAMKWRGYTICRHCATRINKLGETYHDVFVDEILYNIKNHLHSAVLEQSRMEIVL